MMEELRKLQLQTAAQCLFRLSATCAALSSSFYMMASERPEERDAGAKVARRTGELLSKAFEETTSAVAAVAASFGGDS